ncbi:hypothetical protein ACNS7O_13350 [Haloferacaceae archaeon DSL9]
MADDPSLVVQTLRRIAMRANGVLYDRFVRSEEKTRVMDEDWDTLILLDGCRYDTFRRRNFLDGTLESRLSLGSSSDQFLARNFLDGETHHDTIYVTANPYVHTVEENVFFDVVDLINDDERWDATHRTVLPSTVTAAATRVHREFPNKRIIVHYMQPHFPFLGAHSEALEHNTGIYAGRDRESSDKHLWNECQSRLRVDTSGIWSAYEENLDIALRSVEALLEEIHGRVVISADHGNLIGDRLSPIPVRGYGHPRRVHVPELIRVPWHTIDIGERRHTTTDDPRGYTKAGPNRDRLKDLGYLE